MLHLSGQLETCFKHQKELSVVTAQVISPVHRSSFNSQERTAKEQAVKQQKQPGHHNPLSHLEVKKQAIAPCVPSKEATNYSADIITSQRGTVLHNGKYCQKENNECTWVWLLSFLSQVFKMSL